MRRAAGIPRLLGNGAARASPSSAVVEVHRRGQRVAAAAWSGEYAALGLTPFASKADLKHAYKRLALKYHPDVIRGDSWAQEKEQAFKEIKSAYESLMSKAEEECHSTRSTAGIDDDDEWEEWDEWMGFEGGMPIVYNPS